MQSLRISNKDEWKEVTLIEEYVNNHLSYNQIESLLSFMSKITVDNNYHYLNGNQIIFKVFKGLTIHDIKSILILLGLDRI